jgi:hypothetical protein
LGVFDKCSADEHGAEAVTLAFFPAAWAVTAGAYLRTPGPQ